jgi:DNA-directed RNA polymerase subunit H (RpoH/RPB5)
MSTDLEQIDNIYRSRITILDILESRGYIVAPYRKFSPAEIHIAASSGLSSLDLVLKHKDTDDSCALIYTNTTAVAFEKLLNKQEEAHKEVVIMTFVENLEKYHIIAAKYYLANKIRVFCFNIPRIVNNPLNHVMVPKHELVPTEQHKDLLDSMFITEKKMLPHITSADPIIRCIGGLPGDIVRIERPSPSAGTYTVYRLVVP